MNLDEMKRIKEEKGLTCEKIAELSGVPLSTVQKIFAGITKRPRYDNLRALECVFESGSSMVDETVFKYETKKQGEYTIEDYYALPDDVRAELIDGVIYYMGAPSTVHQRIAFKLCKALDDYIESNKGKCMASMTPHDVKLGDDNKTIVQPDVFVVCDREKITKKRIEGAPDMTIEVVSKSSKRHDMYRKLSKYTETGVREYWLIDPDEKKVVVYPLEADKWPIVYGFEDKIPVWIFENKCEIDFAEIYEQVKFLYDIDDADED